MSVVGYGLGRDLLVVGGYAAWGYGIDFIIPPPPAYIPIRFDNQIAIEIRSVRVESEPCQ